VRTRVEVAAWDAPDGVALREAQRVEIDGRYGGDTEPGAKPTAADISVFLLARATDGTAVACGALRHLAGEMAEVKRMFVHPDWRGLGIARQVLAALEDHAAAQGWTVLRLETGERQHEAIGLYLSAGYCRIPNFGPYADAPHSICFERRQTRTPGRYRRQL
jgi:GNAT superfamily N-acetyltransferase